METALIISNLLLWALLLIMAGVIWALVRQIGVLHERVAPAGALMLNNKLKVGSKAPELSANTLTGDELVIGGASVRGKSMLLFFLSPDCVVCKSLLPAIKSVADAEQTWLDIILASDGVSQDHSGLVKTHGLEAFSYLVSEPLGRSYAVSRLPYGVLIDEQGQIAATGLINSREHLDSLFEAKERKVASIQDYIDASKNIDASKDSAKKASGN